MRSRTADLVVRKAWHRAERIDEPGGLRSDLANLRLRFGFLGVDIRSGPGDVHSNGMK